MFGGGAGVGLGIRLKVHWYSGSAARVGRTSSYLSMTGVQPPRTKAGLL